MNNAKSDNKGWISWLLNLIFGPNEKLYEETLTEKDILVKKIILILQKNHPEKLFFYHSTKDLNTKPIEELKRILEELKKE